ncbi:Flagellar biosynthetic protein flhB [Rickettsiales bacterium Ac37b]|nr:Flagellar biosynthetic protein flhB [Rickettsiales bacterium Ac37b]
MSDQEDPSQKTEEPTEQRLKEAFQKGQILSSREVTHFLILIIFTMIIAWFSPIIGSIAKTNFSLYIENSYQIPLDKNNLGHVLIKVLKDLSLVLIIPLLLIVVTSIFSSFIQNQGRLPLATEKIMPKLSNISLITGFNKLFSFRSLAELFKSVIKLILLTLICFFSIKKYLIKLSILHDYSIIYIISFLLFLIIKMMIGICIFMLFVALFDYLYQRHEFYKNMRMSKQELKDEYKKSEGSPEVKSRLKKIRMERARKLMMKAVKTADVIITNPEHFAIALQYDILTMQAPKVVAKGKDHMAMQIRKIAEKHDVPIVENPPLARTLYAVVEIDQYIPVEHYQAVAEIISYVYKLKGKSPNN